MAPWDGPEAFKNGKPFSGGADDYLRLLVEESLPKAEKQLSSPPALRGIMGYSLAGLFGLYTIYQTDEFSWRGMSGSLWFSGFKEYIFSRSPKRRLDCMYFSLGNKEAKPRCSCWMCRRKSYDETQVRDKRAAIVRLDEQQRVALLFSPAMVQSKQGGD